MSANNNKKMKSIRIGVLLLVAVCVMAGSSFDPIREHFTESKSDEAEVLQSDVEEYTLLDEELPEARLLQGRGGRGRGGNTDNKEDDEGFQQTDQPRRPNTRSKPTFGFQSFP